MKQGSFDMKKALIYAIHAEIEASEFYSEWAGNAQGHLKDELTELAKWEKEHQDSLTSHLESAFGEKFVRDPKMVVDPALKVQADEFKNHYALLRIASTVYLSEMRAMELYEKMASESAGEAKKMFVELMDMEKEHMDSAKKRYLEMRDHIVGFHAF
ncbi:MAG: ferritin family protein [Thermovirgaceae bacterium]|nr:ferritin family protein [Thermovirgaceae bacterium]